MHWRAMCGQLLVCRQLGVHITRINVCEHQFDVHFPSEPIWRIYLCHTHLIFYTTKGPICSIEIRLLAHLIGSSMRLNM